MKRNYIPIFLFTFLFLICIHYAFSVDSNWDGGVGLSMIIQASDHSEEIQAQLPYDTEDTQDYYFFLPSYANLSDVSFRKNTYQRILLNGQPLKNGITLDNFQLNVPYELICKSWNGDAVYTITFVQSANVAAMYIHTASGSMDYVHEIKGNKESGSITVYTVDGDLNHAGFLNHIKGRGNSTWDSEKKPYNIELFHEANLLGMGTAANWVLLAEYSDLSFINNKLTYDFAAKLGLPFSPDCNWVDLYVNGKYSGLYLLSERTEVHPNRVNIPQEGTFLVTLDGYSKLLRKGITPIAAKDELGLRVRHAGIPTEEIERIWISARNAIEAENGIDPVTGKSWEELIDIDSWALRYLIDEIFANSDGGALSQNFFYANLGDGNKLYAGPVWDMDRTFGTFGFAYRDDPENTILAGRKHIVYEWDMPIFYHLLQKDRFFHRVIELYGTVVLPGVHRLILNEMHQYPVKLHHARYMESLCWNYDEFPEIYSINRIYLQKRIAFLNDYWLSKEPYHLVCLNYKDGNLWSSYAICSGEHLHPITTPEGYGWYRYDDNTLFDVSQPIYEDVMLYCAPIFSLS